MEKKNNISVLYIQGVDTVVIKKDPESSLFTTTDDSLIIGRQTLVLLLKFLVTNKIIHPRTLEGLLEEMNTS